ncbi:jg4918 [Pararge aegeria aegeria]|uniref:Jg4918 protein n=1 Tax=Pararge aegeria aegeria TaxID=348720 RepID=A0A8S4SC86_9NEOP|nr:jg4918 [Pararge aegeria aegeria]
MFGKTPSCRLALPSDDRSEGIESAPVAHTRKISLETDNQSGKLYINRLLHLSALGRRGGLRPEQPVACIEGLSWLAGSWSQMPAPDLWACQVLASVATLFYHHHQHHQSIKKAKASFLIEERVLEHKLTKQFQYQLVDTFTHPHNLHYRARVSSRKEKSVGRSPPH